MNPGGSFVCLFVSFWFWFLFACLFLSKVSSGANKKMTSVGTTCVNKRKPHRWLPVWGQWVKWKKQHWPNPWDSASWTQAAGPTEKHSLHHACLECPQQAPDSGQLSLYCLLLRATSVICQGELWRTRSLSLTIKWSLQRSWTQPLARLSGRFYLHLSPHHSALKPRAVLTIIWGDNGLQSHIDLEIIEIPWSFFLRNLV